MRGVFGFTVATLITLLLGYFTWIHLKHSADSVELRPDVASRDAAEFAQRARKETEETYKAPQNDQDSETVAGPLVSFMKGISKVETVEATYRATESDRVGDSVV